MRRILIAALTLFCAMCHFSGSATESAASIIQNASAKLSRAGNISSDFTIIDPEQGPVDGSLFVAGEKFVMTTPFATTIFDGKTQWTINPADKEVSICEPTADEIAQLNPFSIIAAYTSAYNPRLVTSPEGQRKIRLTPKSPESPFSQIILTLDANTLYPISIDLTSDGETARIDIKNLRTGVNLPAPLFVFKKADYSGYEIIDLR